MLNQKDKFNPLIFCSFTFLFKAFALPSEIVFNLTHILLPIHRYATRWVSHVISDIQLHPDSVNAMLVEVGKNAFDCVKLFARIILYANQESPPRLVMYASIA